MPGAPDLNLRKAGCFHQGRQVAEIVLHHPMAHDQRCQVPEQRVARRLEIQREKAAAWLEHAAHLGQGSGPQVLGQVVEHQAAWMIDLILFLCQSLFRLQKDYSIFKILISPMEMIVSILINLSMMEKIHPFQQN